MSNMTENFLFQMKYFRTLLEIWNNVFKNHQNDYSVFFPEAEEQTFIVKIEFET